MILAIQGFCFPKNVDNNTLLGGVDRGRSSCWKAKAAAAGDEITGGMEVKGDDKDVEAAIEAAPTPTIAPNPTNIIR